MIHSIIFFPPENRWFYHCLISVFVGLIVYLWQFRTSAGAWQLIANQFAKIVYVSSYLFVGVANTAAVGFFWANVALFARIFILLFWLEFILAVGQLKQYVSYPIRCAIWLSVLCVIARIILDGGCDWYWLSYTMEGELQLISGPGHAVFSLSIYLLCLAGLGLCLKWILSVRGLLRKQAIWLTVPALFTMAGSFLDKIGGLSPYSPGVLSLAVSGLLSTWAFYHYGLYRILPLANTRIIEEMTDALIVVDNNGYLAEMNQKARTLLDHKGKIFGKHFHEIVADWPLLAGLCNEKAPKRYELEQDFDSGTRQMRITKLPLVSTSKKLLGTIFILRDITQEKRKEAERIAQQKTLSVLTERCRLGRELHDNMAQFPGFVKTQAQVIELLLQQNRQDEASAYTRQLMSVADTAFYDARETLSALHLKGSEWDFFTELNAWFSCFRTMSSISVDYLGPYHKPARWIAPEAEIQLLRIMQESMTNARKHGKVSKIQIRLKTGVSFLEVSLEDDGVGFDTASTEHNAHIHGLDIMRERAIECGGTCTIISQPGRGTRVSTILPVHAGVP